MAEEVEEDREADQEEEVAQAVELDPLRDHRTIKRQMEILTLLLQVTIIH